MRAFRTPTAVAMRTALLALVCLSCAADLPPDDPSRAARSRREDLTSYRVLLQALREGGTGPSLVLLTVKNEDTGETARLAFSGDSWRFLLSDLGYEWEDGFIRHMMRNHKEPIPVPAKLFGELREQEGEWLPEHEQALSMGREYVVQNYMAKGEDNEDVSHIWDSDRFGRYPTPENAGVVRLLLEAGLDVSIGCLDGGVWAAYCPDIDEMDADYHERELLAKVVGGIIPPEEEHVPLMARCLSDEDEEWAYSHIIRTLVEMGSAAAPALPTLLGQLDYNYGRGNPYVLLAVRQIAPDPAGLLTDALDRMGFGLQRSGIAWALGELGPEAKEAVPALMECLDDEWADRRVAAARAIWKITGEAEEVVPAVMEVLEYEDKRDRRAALELLGEMGPKAAQAVPALIRSLKDEAWIPRSRAARALGRIGPEAAASIPALIDALEDDSRFVFEEVAKALRTLNAPAEMVVPALIKALLDERSPSLKAEAADAVGEFGPAAKPAGPALVRALQEKEWQIECAAADALGRIGPGAAAALPALEKVAREEEARNLRGQEEEFRHLRALDERCVPGAVFSARLAVARAVWRITGDADRVAPTLAKVLKCDVAAWQFDAAKLLEEMGPAGAAALPALGEFAKQEEKWEEARPYMKRIDYKRRLAAARTLWKVTSDPARVVPVLLRALERGQPWDRARAAKTLMDIGPAARGAVPALERALDSKDDDLQAAAAKALRAIRGKDVGPKP